MPGPRLTRDERGILAALRGLNHSQEEIAKALGRHKSTISRELTRNNSGRHAPQRGSKNVDAWRTTEPSGEVSGTARADRRGNDRWGYDPDWAQRHATTRARRPKLAKLAPAGAQLRANPTRYRQSPGPVRVTAEGTLRHVVREKLRARWSPRQICSWLKVTHPFTPELHVSPETIYQALYVQTRGNLREELAGQEALRSGRTRRRARTQAAGAIRSGRPWARGHHISTRPAEASDRAVPGHWEGDLIIGAGGDSAIITLVERSTRYVMLGHLPGYRASIDVVTVLSELAQRLPGHLMRTLTWDNGNEMAQHAKFTVASDCQVFFADPHSPWQRGSNENTNGLLRQYFPKGRTDFLQLSQEELDAVAAELNGRPRQTLEWRNPRQALQEALVATTP